jgi:hypothetical protein
MFDAAVAGVHGYVVREEGDVSDAQRGWFWFLERVVQLRMASFGEFYHHIMRHQQIVYAYLTTNGHLADEMDPDYNPLIAFQFVATQALYNETNDQITALLTTTPGAEIVAIARRLHIMVEQYSAFPTIGRELNELWGHVPPGYKPPSPKKGSPFTSPPSYRPPKRGRSPPPGGAPPPMGTVATRFTRR